jgi:surface carbohydrate biosynthesis protein
MSTRARTLLLPVETASRELDGKILLALAARERGWTVYLGDQLVVRDQFATLPRGIYLAKSARIKNAAIFRRMHAVGDAVAVLDEESLVRQTDDIYLKKHERDALRHVGVLMTWGEENRALWAQSGLYDPARIFATGNPRVDMLRKELRAFHEPEIADIRRRFGDYILFNSNFATVNHFATGRSRFRLASWVPAEEEERQKTALTAHKRALFDAFREVLSEVARAVAPVTLVFRPHPSESLVPWEDAVAGIGNAAVVYEGSVVPWLAGAKALVHNGCTTAVEAAVLGTPRIAYRPVTSPSFDNPLPNDLSVEAFSKDDLLAAVKNVLEEGPRPLTAEQQATLDHFLVGLSGPLAADNIVKALETLEPDGDGVLNRLRGPLQVAVDAYRAAVKRAVRAPFGRGAHRRTYTEHKFPTLSADAVNERVLRFQQALGRFVGAAPREVRRNLFVFD